MPKYTNLTREYTHTRKISELYDLTKGNKGSFEASQLIGLKTEGKRSLDFFQRIERTQETGDVETQSVASLYQERGHTNEESPVVLNIPQGATKHITRCWSCHTQEMRHTSFAILHPKLHKEPLNVVGVFDNRQQLLQQLLDIRFVLLHLPPKHLSVRRAQGQDSLREPIAGSLHHRNEEGTRVVTDKFQRETPEISLRQMGGKLLAQHIARRSELCIGQCVEIRKKAQPIVLTHKYLQASTDGWVIMFVVTQRESILNYFHLRTRSVNF